MRNVHAIREVVCRPPRWPARSPNQRAIRSLKPDGFPARITRIFLWTLRAYQAEPKLAAEGLEAQPAASSSAGHNRTEDRGRERERVAASDFLIPWNHVEPKRYSVAAVYDRRTGSAACLGGHPPSPSFGGTSRPPLQVSQFPTLGSVVFHVSRQLAWRDQEVSGSGP